MKKFRILMGAMALVVVAVTVIACNKEKESNVVHQAMETDLVVIKPIATFDNTTKQMICHYDLFEIQQNLNEETTTRTIQDRYVIESIQVLDSVPNDQSILPEVKITVFDTEEETAYTFWLMQNFTEKEVAQNETRYYVETGVRTGVYEFGYRIGEQYYIVSVNGDNYVISEIDSSMCMSSGLPKFLLWCRSENCTNECTKTGSWYNAHCNACGDNQGGKCNEEVHPWVDVAGVVVAIIGIIVAL